MTPEVTPEVMSEDLLRLIKVMRGEMSRTEIQAALGLRDEKHFREGYLGPMLQAGMLEMTIPLKPRSRLQKYRLTSRGHEMQAVLEAKA